jgi:SAM-dependent methyltransferase
LVQLTFTNERLIPGIHDVSLFKEHEDRYNFVTPFVKGKSVVDIACGIGMGTQLLRDAGASQVIGVDKDASAVDYAREEYPDCIFVKSDAQDLPLENSSADIIISFETIEHLSDPARFLKECKRILKRSGFFICSTPNRRVNSWWGSNPYHIREFLPEELLQLAGSFFVDLEVYGQRRVLYPAFVGRRVVSGLLERIHLKAPLARVMARNPPATWNENKYTLDGRRASKEIQPYSKSWLVKPHYFLVTARKAD